MIDTVIVVWKHRTMRYCFQLQSICTYRISSKNLASLIFGTPNSREWEKLSAREFPQFNV